VPGRDDRVVHQVLPVTEAGAAFAFVPVTGETPDGPASLQGTGTVALPGAERLVFSTTRWATTAEVTETVDLRNINKSLQLVVQVALGLIATDHPAQDGR
jgi:hypothetical protein